MFLIIYYCFVGQPVAAAPMTVEELERQMMAQQDQQQQIRHLQQVQHQRQQQQQQQHQQQVSQVIEFLL